MDWIQAIVLSLVQGLAEFLPISSSGHLAILEHFFHIETENILFFNVMLHLGTLVAVFAAYWKDIVEMVKEFFRIFTDKLPGPVPPARRMIVLLLIATLPLVLVLFFDDVVEKATSQPLFVGGALLATGVLLLIADRVPKGKKNAGSARVSDVVFVGGMQVLATLPGLSRSGLTISAGLLRGFERQFAVRFSFLMSIPAVLGATVLETKKAFDEGFDTALLPKMLVGMAIAAVVGFFAIKLVRKLIDNNKFGVFAWYCLVVGAAVIIILLVQGGR